MTNHPITPPPELVQEWREQMPVGIFDGYKYPEREKALCLVAAQWGADQELEACVQLTRDNDGYDAALGLRATRRPKQPSLKEQALDALKVLPTPAGQVTIDITDLNTIRRALEALPND
jgi:hypothetical protein